MARYSGKILAAGGERIWYYLVYIVINSSAGGSLLYTYENLTERDFSFFESLDIKGYYKNPSASYENQWRSSGLDHFEKRINDVKVLKSDYAVSIREKSQIVADGKKLLETDTIYTVGSNGMEINRTVRRKRCMYRTCVLANVADGNRYVM